MGYLDENEWILLNEIAYNISYIFTVEEMHIAGCCTAISVPHFGSLLFGKRIS